MTSAVATNPSSDFGSMKWYAELAPSERRTFWACFGGWALDALDVQIFSFAIPAIIATFSITNVDAGLIGTVTLLTSAFGGWAAGMLADRFGRVRTLQITIVWFAVFTFLCGFSQTYNQLLISRALMGFGFGGEWAAGAVLMGEVIRARHRGKAVGFVQWMVHRLGRSCNTLDFAFHCVSARYRLADSVLGWLGPSIHCLFFAALR